MAPFSPDVRTEIGIRDNFTCDCGRSYQKGWVIEMAHYDHNRNEHYNEPENGRSSCRACHLRESIGHMLDDEPHHGLGVVKMQVMRCYKEGLHLRKKKNAWTLRKDRTEVIEILNSYGLNPDEFLR